MRGTSYRRSKFMSDKGSIMGSHLCVFCLYDNYVLLNWSGVNHKLVWDFCAFNKSMAKSLY